VNEMGILRPRTSKFGNLSEKHEEAPMKSLGAFSIGKKVDVQTPGSKLLRIEDFILHNMGKSRPRYNGLKPDAIYRTFYKFESKHRYKLIINIGVTIIESLGFKKGEKPRMVLCHHPEDIKILLLFKSDNGNVLQRQGKNTWTLNLSWDCQSSWIPSDDEIKEKKEVEFELYDNAIQIYA
jgi:hypothetical protein